MRIFILFLIAVLMFTGCSQSNIINSVTESIHNPTAKEVLDGNPNADIFQHGGIVYINAHHIDWVQQTELTIGERVGTITKQYKDGLTFEDGMATTLPVGVEIFKSGPILFVKLDDKEIRYHGLIEG